MRDAETPVVAPRSGPTAPTLPTAEIARLGEEIYERDIRRQVEADQHGRIVSIDVDSGSWALGDNVLDSAGRLREQRPDAINVWSERVGYPTLRHFGGRPLRNTR